MNPNARCVPERLELVGYQSVGYIRPQLFLTAPVGDFEMYNEYKPKLMLLFFLN